MILTFLLTTTLILHCPTKTLSTRNRMRIAREGENGGARSSASHARSTPVFTLLLLLPSAICRIIARCPLRTPTLVFMRCKPSLTSRIVAQRHCGQSLMWDASGFGVEFL